MAGNSLLFGNGVPVPFYGETFILGRSNVELHADQVLLEVQLLGHLEPRPYFSWSLVIRIESVGDPALVADRLSLGLRCLKLHSLCAVIDDGVAALVADHLGPGLRCLNLSSFLHRPSQIPHARARSNSSSHRLRQIPPPPGLLSHRLRIRIELEPHGLNAAPCSASPPPPFLISLDTGSSLFPPPPPPWC